MDDSVIEEQENIPQLYKKSKKPQIDIAKVCEYIDAQEDDKVMVKKYSQYFDEWVNYLLCGFNIMITGRGSKISLLHRFMESKKVMNDSFIEVMGHESDVSLLEAFKVVADKLEIDVRFKRDSIINHAEIIGNAIEEKNSDFLFVIHNIDGPCLRSEQAMEAIKKLGSFSHVKIIMTLAFQYGDIYWNPDMKYSLKLIEYDINTYRIDLDELLALNPKLESHGGKNDSYHTLESLDMIWTSLAANTQKICIKLYEMWLQSENRAVSFFELFTEVRKNFLTTSEVVLNTQITELKDHYFISVNDDKVITFFVEPMLLAQFMEDKLSL
ncbi:unnamed protein product [Bursaphelenchus okinawaensis]|uniref:Origin recognition complex subunit 2 n=1 Tax=Bursaphelenchus okinawaensis TaxID=465554 RepID=A0A811K6E8_9BILA|nr:unnamed protein product [Bursaphelenchus okinawaensis]CAG9093876.1 unnamed protein product [Bursaphelenchus okinawaensis]